MKKLHRYVLKHWPFYLLALLSMFVAIGLDMLYPQITKIIVNEDVYNIVTKEKKRGIYQ
jgi:ATP-binding cassette subfamily B protein